MVDVVMPKMGESITEGTVIEWKKSVGDSIKKDETLLEISTDKVDSEIPSPASGTIVEIMAQVNDTIPVGNVLARIGDTSEDIIDKSKQNVPKKNQEVETKKDLEPSISEIQVIPEEKVVEKLKVASRGRFYSPLVRSIAKAENIS